MSTRTNRAYLSAIAVLGMTGALAYGPVATAEPDSDSTGCYTTETEIVCVGPEQFPTPSADGRCIKTLSRPACVDPGLTPTQTPDGTWRLPVRDAVSVEPVLGGVSPAPISGGQRPAGTPHFPRRLSPGPQ
jgi:hypothetical protein